MTARKRRRPRPANDNAIGAGEWAAMTDADGSGARLVATLEALARAYVPAPGE